MVNLLFSMVYFKSIKVHVKNTFDCDAYTLSKVMDTVKMISNHLVYKCGYERRESVECK